MKEHKHLVTCGDCGEVNKVNTNDEEYECDGCGYISEPCDFPDYIYKTNNIMILKYEVQWDSDGDLTHIRYAQDFETIEEARIALALHNKRNAVLTVKQIRE